MLNKVSQSTFNEFVRVFDLRPVGINQKVYYFEGKIVAYKHTTQYFISMASPSIELTVVKEQDPSKGEGSVRYAVFGSGGSLLGHIEVDTAFNPYNPGKLSDGCSFRPTMRDSKVPSSYIQQAYFSILMEMDAINKSLAEGE